MRRWDWLVAAGVALVMFLAGVWFMVPGVCGTYHDDAIYVCTAKSLAEGQGYRLINLPGSPPQAKYPIIYPALLAMVWKLGPSSPDNISVMQVINILLSSLALGFGYLYLLSCKYCGRLAAALIMAICATSYHFLQFATLTLSEPLFLLTAVLALWALESGDTHTSENWLLGFLLGLLLAVPFLVRSMGIVLVVAGLLYLWRQKRRVLPVLLGTLAGVLPWIAWMAWNFLEVNRDPSAVYYTGYIKWYLSMGLPSLLKVAIYNLWYLLLSLPLAAIPGVAAAVGGGILIAVACVVGVVFIVGTLTIYTKWRLLALFNLLYLALVVVWAWPPFRFVVAVMPLLLVVIPVGWRNLAKRFAGIKLLTWTQVVVVLALVGFNLAASSRLHALRVATGYPHTSQKSMLVVWSSYQALFAWVKENTAPASVLITGLDSMLYLYTGRKSMRAFVAEPAKLFYGGVGDPLGGTPALKKLMYEYRPQYLVDVPMPGFSEANSLRDNIAEVLQKSPGFLGKVYAGRDKRFAVYRINYIDN